MKVKAVTYTDDEEIETITVVMTLSEAAAIHAISGRLTGYAERRLGLKTSDSLYGALSTLFDGHYEDGSPPGAPRLPSAWFEKINEKPT